MSRHIMVPLDGSELAERALPCAERLALAANATLHLVRIVEPLVKRSYVPAASYTDLIVAKEAAATAYLSALREQRTTAYRLVQTTVLIGDPSALLVDYERDASIDLVVMCSHGRTGLARFILGSIAERLLRHGTAHVLLIRPFGMPACLPHIVVPLDGSGRAEVALQILTDLLPDTVRDITLLRVIDAPGDGPEAERYLGGIVDRLRQDASPLRDAAYATRIACGDPAQLIVDTAGAEKMVVMATHGRSGPVRAALGSVAERVVHGGTAGVLLVRAGTLHAA